MFLSFYKVKYKVVMLNNNGSGSLMKPYILSTSTVSIVHKRKSVPHSPPHRRCGTKLPVDFCSPNFARPHDPGAERPRVFCRQAVASTLTPRSNIVSELTGTADAYNASHRRSVVQISRPQTSPTPAATGGGAAAANKLPGAASLAAPGAGTSAVFLGVEDSNLQTSKTIFLQMF